RAGDYELLLDVVGPLPRFGLDRVAGPTFQLPPGSLRQVFCQGPDVGHAVVAEDEADALVGVPAVEVLGLGEVGVATEQHASKAAAEADRQGPVHLPGRAPVRR